MLRRLSSMKRSRKLSYVPCHKCVDWCDSMECQDRMVREYELDEEMQQSKKRVRVSSKASNLASNWKEYFNSSSFKDESSHDKRFLAETLTYSLTSAFHVRDMVDKKRTIIRLDIVGARAEAFSPPWVWKAFSNQLIEPTKVVIRFIGPQVPRPGVIEEKNLRLEYIQNTYDPDLTSPPDFVFMFNPGFSSSLNKKETPRIHDLWLESFDKIRSLDKSVHIISSAYDPNDLKSDIIALNRADIHVTKPELNPFGGLRLWKDPRYSSESTTQFVRTNWATYKWIR